MTLIASFNCIQCDCGKFHLVQIENTIHILCCECSHIVEFQEPLDQLKKVKKELEGDVKNE